MPAPRVREFWRETEWAWASGTVSECDGEKGREAAAPVRVGVSVSVSVSVYMKALVS